MYLFQRLTWSVALTLLGYLARTYRTVFVCPCRRALWRGVIPEDRQDREEKGIWNHSQSSQHRNQWMCYRLCVFVPYASRAVASGARSISDLTRRTSPSSTALWIASIFDWNAKWTFWKKERITIVSEGFPSTRLLPDTVRVPWGIPCSQCSVSVCLSACVPVRPIRVVRVWPLRPIQSNCRFLPREAHLNRMTIKTLMWAVRYTSVHC